MSSETSSNASSQSSETSADGDSLLRTVASSQHQNQQVMGTSAPSTSQFAGRNYSAMKKLSDDNWLDWKFQLMSNAMIVDGDQLLSAGIVKFEDVVTSADEEVKASFPPNNEPRFKSVNREIGIFISNTLSDSAIVLVRHISSRDGLAMFKVLSDHYESKRGTALKTLIKNLVTVNQGSMSIPAYLDHVLNLRERLMKIRRDNAQFDFIDEFVKVCLLEGLSTDYSTINELLTIVQDDTKPMKINQYVDVIKAKAEQLDSNRIQLSSASSCTAHVVHMPKAQQAIICSYCGKQGHHESVCFKKKRDMKNSTANSTTSVSQDAGHSNVKLAKRGLQNEST